MGRGIEGVVRIPVADMYARIADERMIGSGVRFCSPSQSGIVPNLAYRIDNRITDCGRAICQYDGIISAEVKDRI